MPKYEVIIYWSVEDESFIAEVLELPGCAADGKTYQQALANVEIIIREWIATAKELIAPSAHRRAASSSRERNTSKKLEYEAVRRLILSCRRPIAHLLEVRLYFSVAVIISP